MSFGVFSLIQDQKFFDIVSVASSQRKIPIVQNGKIVDDYKLLNYIPNTTPIGVLVASTATLDDKTIKYQRMTLPGTYLIRKSITGDNGSNVEETFNDTNVRIEYTVTEGLSTLCNTWFIEVGTISHRFSYWPYGSTSHYKSSVDHIYTSIVVVNSDFTDCYVLYFLNEYGEINAGVEHLDSAVKYILSVFSTATPIAEVTEDPYHQGGNTTDGGGGGTFGGGSTIFGGNTDPVDIPDLPSLSAVDTGFITLFNPTLSQLNSLASYMWSDVFSLDTFKKLYADPMDCILGLSIVPVQPTSGGTGTVKIGNISTDVTMNKASSQYVSVDCGTVEVKEYWGGYLDYSPYTKCEIYLPYVGVHEISVDDIMNKSVHIVYHVDILSGACNAYVKCGDSVLYTFIGQCSSSIPISGNDWTNTINGVLSIAGNIGSLVASGGASAPTELPSMAQNAVNALKPNVEKSGAMSGTGGMLGIQKPYIILTRPNQALPENQNKYTGYPSFITMNLSECSGYTEIETIRLENMTCTDAELTEIETLLKQGVVF